MKKKFVWMLLSFLLVVALVLASCAPAVGEQEEEEEEEEPVGEQEEEEEEEEVVPVPGEPQRGGTLTVLHQWPTDDPPSPAQNDSQIVAVWWLEPIQEHLLIGDIETYGGMGNGEFRFDYNGYLPPKYVKGNLVESWEVNSDQAVLNVRPGIYWAPNEDQKAWMPVRELTAEDIAADINAFWKAPWGTRFNGVLKRVYATDRYTVVCEFEEFDTQFMYYIGTEDRSIYSPPEMETAGANLWKNQVGTGPFMFEEYVIGSHMSYVRNPNWWQTATINGVEYQMPFVDRLVYPIIPDEATQVAALRTGKVDYQVFVPVSQWDTLDKLSPQLLSVHCGRGRGDTIGLNCTEPPFDDVNVRRAVMIGTDLKAFAKLQHAEELSKHWCPFDPGNPTVYTPLEELPAEIQVLYDYNPKLAIEMLDKAGYPEGLKTAIYADPSTLNQAMAILVKDQWAKIGVDVEIVVKEPSAMVQYKYTVTYKGTICMPIEVANPITSLTAQGKTGGYINFSGWSNSRFDELMDRLVLESDVGEQNRLCKEAALLWLNEVPYIPINPIVNGGYWWPWLKNYYGEYSLADQGTASIMPYIWIDQVLKAEMGYK